MFSDTGPSSIGGEGEDVIILPFTLAESSNTLYAMLKWCHPLCKSMSLDTIEDVDDILEVARKYDLGGLLEDTRDKLKYFLKSLMVEEPVKSYAIACRSNS